MNVPFTTIQLRCAVGQPSMGRYPTNLEDRPAVPQYAKNTSAICIDVSVTPLQCALGQPSMNSQKKTATGLHLAATPLQRSMCKPLTLTGCSYADLEVI